MFSPAIGIVEDPVTGNANGPMGAWLVHHNVLPHDGKVLRVKGNQGRALGRDGVIEVTVTIRDNQPEKSHHFWRGGDFCFMPNGQLNSETVA